MKKMIVSSCYKIFFLSYLFFYALTVNAQAFWQDLAQKDLTNLKHLIQENHPGYVDSQNPSFKTWFDQGLNKANEQLKYVDSYYGHHFLLTQFINGFEDGHLKIIPILDFRIIKWPGFIVTLRNDEYIVNHLTEDPRFSQLPPIGAKLLQCGEQPPEYFMKNNVFPYFSQAIFPSTWIVNAPLLFLDFNNPFVLMPNRCTFQFNQKNTSYQLDWHETNKSTIWPHVRLSSFGKPKAFEVRPFLGGTWVSIPTLSIIGEHVDAMKNLIKELPKLREQPRLVIDLRSNGGGSTEWGDQILQALFGNRYLALLESRLDSGQQYIEYRASKNNYRHFSNMLPTIAQQYGEASRFYKHFASAVKGLENALLNDKPFYRVEIDMKKAIQSINGKAQNPTSGKIFVLTDGACGSACLGFMDKLLKADNVIHIGLPTSGDTVYMDLAQAKLPSGLFVLNYATKVYRNRVRGHNEFYQPQHIWKQDINDTQAIEQWIMSL